MAQLSWKRFTKSSRCRCLPLLVSFHYHRMSLQQTNTATITVSTTQVHRLQPAWYKGVSNDTLDILRTEGNAVIYGTFEFIQTVKFCPLTDRSSICFTVSLETASLRQPHSTLTLFSLYFCHFHCLCSISSFVIHSSLSLFHSQLKTYLFKSFPP